MITNVDTMPGISDHEVILFDITIQSSIIPESQSRSRRSGWSGFGRTTISQGKNKITFYKKQVINKSTRVIFGLAQLVIL